MQWITGLVIKYISLVYYMIKVILLVVAVVELMVTIVTKLSSDSSIDIASIFDPSHYQLFLISYTASTSLVGEYTLLLYLQCTILCCDSN